MKLLKEIFTQNWIKKTCRLIMVSLFIEMFFCNFRSWLWLGYEKKDLIGLNAIVCSDGQYEEDGHIIAPFRDDGWCDIDTGRIDVDARNIYLSVQYLDSGLQPVETEFVVDCTIKASDEGNKLLYGLGARKFCNKVDRGNYYSINLYGNARAFELTFQKPENEAVKYVYLSEFAVNKRVPLYFSWLRFLGIIMFCVFAEVCRTYWNQPFYSETECREKKIIVVFLAGFLMIYSLVFTNANPVRRNADTYKTMYHDLTKVYCRGSFILRKNLQRHFC